MQNQSLSQVLNDISQNQREQILKGNELALEYRSVIDRINSAKIFRSNQNYDRLIKVIRNYLKGKGWSNINISKAQKPLFDALYGKHPKETEWPQLIQNVKSAMISIDNIEVTCTPSGSDESMQMAATLSDLVSWFFADNNNKRELQKAKVESRGLPMSVTAMLTTPPDQLSLGQSPIYLQNIPIEKFWWQPSVTDIANCDYAFIGDVYSWDQILAARNEKGFDKALIERLHQAAVTTALGQNKLNDAGNASISKQYYEYFSFIDNNITATDLQYKVPVYYFYQRTREKNDWVVYRYTVLYGDVVVGKQRLKITHLPFATLKEYNYEGSFYGRSSVEIALPTIEVLMKLDAKILKTIADNLTGVTLVPPGFNVKNILNARKTGKAVVEVAENVIANYGAAPLLHIDPYKLDEQTMLMKQNLLQELQTITGLNQITLGEGFGSATNGSAVNSMIAQSTSRDLDAIQEFSLYIYRLAILFIDALTNDFLSGTQTHTFYLPNNDASDYSKGTAFKPIVIDAADIKNSIGTVNVNAKLLKASTNDQELAQLMSLLQITLQNPPRPDAVVKAQDVINLMSVKNKREILQRAMSQEEVIRINQTAAIIDKFSKLSQIPQGESIPIETAAALISQDIQQQTQAALAGQEVQSQIDVLYEQAMAQQQQQAQIAQEDISEEEQAMLYEQALASQQEMM